MCCGEEQTDWPSPVFCPCRCPCRPFLQMMWTAKSLLVWAEEKDEGEVEVVIVLKCRWELERAVPVRGHCAVLG